MDPSGDPSARSELRGALVAQYVLVALVLLFLDPFDVSRVTQFRALAGSVLPVLGSDALTPGALQISLLGFLCLPLGVLIVLGRKAGGALPAAVSAVALCSVALGLASIWDTPSGGLVPGCAGVAIGHAAGAWWASLRRALGQRRPDVSRVLARFHTRVIAVTCAGGILVAVLGSPLFVFSPRESPTDALGADAVVVLGPAEPARVELARRVALARPGTPLVISSTSKRGGFTDAECNESDVHPVLCFAATPFTTAGEASAVERLAESHHWTEVAYVTSVPHVSRVRRVMERCTSPDVLVVAADAPTSPSDWGFAYVYQIAATAKEILRPPC